LLIVSERANGNLQSHIIAGVAGAVRAFAVAAAIGFEFAVVAVAQQRVVVGIGFEVDAAAVAAIAAGRSAARNVFFAAERDAAVAAVAGLYEDFGLINEH
jgi:hypothetical protein